FGAPCSRLAPQRRIAPIERNVARIDLPSTRICRILCEEGANRRCHMRQDDDRLDDRDRAILRLLQADGRLTNVHLAHPGNLSPSACLRRVKLLEERGLIDRYVMLLDPREAGLPGVAFVLVTLDQQGRASLDAFEQAVQRHPEVSECCLLAGAADYMVRVVY